MHTRAEVIAAARRRKGWTQTDLAEAACTTQGTISRVESGDIQPTIALLETILAALDLTWADLPKPTKVAS